MGGGRRGNHRSHGLLTRVVAYPATPGASLSQSVKASADGTFLQVEGYGELHYARFAADGSVVVDVRVPRPIERWQVFPPSRAGAVSIAHDTLTIELPAPRPVVVWIDDLPRLLLLAEPLESETESVGDVVLVTDLGADPTGKSLATSALQAAIDRVGDHDRGGTVVISAGRFLTGALQLRSGVHLRLEPGALLQGSDDPRHYPIDPGRVESARDEGLPPDQRFLGRTMTFSRLLLIDRAEGVSISGHGTIDGAGTELRTRHGAVPNLLRVRESRDVDISGVLFRNAAAWSLHVLASRDVRIHDVAVINDRNNLNTDGIDADMSQDVSIDRCVIDTKDDGVCVKATGNSDLHGEPARVLVRNSLVSSRDAALKLGTESDAESFRDIRFEDCAVYESGRAMSVVVRDGARYEDVSFRGIEIAPRVDHLVEQVIGVRDPETRLGTIRDLTFDNIQAPEYVAPDSAWTWYAQFRPGRPPADASVPVFEGADEQHAVDGLTLRNVVVRGQRLVDAETAERVAGVTIGEHVRNIRFE